MKKEIEKLLESENGRLEINSMFELKRCKKDGLGNEVDSLELILKTINGVEYSQKTELYEREYSLLMSEINLHMRVMLQHLQDKLIKNLENGYVD